MCPKQVPTGTDWVAIRDFKDSGQAQDTGAGLSSYVSHAISKYYAGNLSRLGSAVNALGKTTKMVYPYELSTVFTALPRFSILFLFNDAEEQFPAQVAVLFEQRAASFIDAECRIMVAWYLLEGLKRVEQ